MMLSLTGGRVMLADGSIEDASIHIEGGIIGAVGEAAMPTKQTWNIGGHLVLPAIIDLHGDAFERQIMPRPGVHFPLNVALLDTDRQMAANGIATAYHGITYSWEPGLRGRDTAVALVEALDKNRSRLVCDTRVHLRYETYNVAGLEDVSAWMKAGAVDLLAFNDHMPLIQANVDNPNKLAKYADRTGLAQSDFLKLLERTLANAPQVNANLHRLANEANALDIPCASHDDETPDMRAMYSDMGVALCEFPMDKPTAQYAVDHGDPVIMGGPNVMRGGSHCDRLCATDAARSGLCSVLTSDYYYPSLVQAPFKLANDGVVDFATAWAMVSTNPAEAAGLHDRGSIAKDKRADLVIVDDRDQSCPRVIATFVAGRPVHMDGAGYRMCA